MLMLCNACSVAPGSEIKGGVEWGYDDLFRLPLKLHLSGTPWVRRHYLPDLPKIPTGSIRKKL
jgi:hypothetical protein